MRCATEISSNSYIVLIIQIKGLTMLKREDIIGEWLLVDAQMIVDGEVQNTFNKDRKMVKLLTECGRFSFYSKTEQRLAFSAEVTDQERLLGSKTLDTGGGTFDLDDNIYTEHVTYCSYPNYEDKSIDFTLSLEGDKLIQEGPYPLKMLGFADKDAYVKEIYQRIR